MASPTSNGKTAAAIGAVAVLLAALAYAATPKPSPKPPPTTTTSTTVPVTPSGCSIPVTDLPRAWEQPAGQIATAGQAAKWADRIVNYSDERVGILTISLEAGINEQPGSDYSIPYYCAADATTTIRVYPRPNYPGSWNLPRGTRVPWNPKWRPADGADGFLIIYDPATGHEWDLWVVSSPTSSDPATRPQTACQLDANNLLPKSVLVPNGLPTGTPAFNPDRDACAASANIITTPAGTPADMRTYRGNMPPAGGGGLPNSVGLVTPDEVASGTIRHALKYAVGQQLSMTGPACPPSVTVDDPAVGAVCGQSVAPAGQFESRNLSANPAPCTPIPGTSGCLAGMVPDGTRWTLNKTDAEIDDWLAANRYSGRTAKSLRTILVAWRDYGLIQTSTTKEKATIQVAGGTTAIPQWETLGLGGDVNLDHIFTIVDDPTDVRVLAPAVNTCDGRPSRTACWATDITNQAS